MMTTNPLSKVVGFTLWECILCVFLFSLTSSFLLPVSWEWFSRYKNYGLMQELIKTLVFVQQTSLVYGQAITWCPTMDSVHCTKDWSGNQMVFVDPKLEGMRSLAQPILRFIQYDKRQGFLDWSGFNQKFYLTALPYGLSETMNGRFVYQATRGSQETQVLLVNRLGRWRLISKN